MICLGTANRDGTVTLTAEEAGWLRELFMRLDTVQTVTRTTVRDLNRATGLLESLKDRGTYALAQVAGPEAVTHRVVRCPPSSNAEAERCMALNLTEHGPADAAVESRMVVLRKGLPPTPYGMHRRERDHVKGRTLDLPSPVAATHPMTAQPAFTVRPSIITPEGFQ